MNEQELFNVPVPEETDSYSPVSHKQIVEEIEENIDKTGLEISSKQYKAAQKGKVVTGLIDVTADSDIFNYRFAFQNSYNKERPLAFVGGTSVMICSNGMILGESKLVRRHTGSITQEMNDHIQTVIQDLEQLLEDTQKHGEQMKQIEMDPTATAELCGRMFMEQDIITSTQLNIIRRQLEDPDYPEFAEPTLWSLYNHTTHALKKTHAYEYTQKHRQFQEFIEQEYQLT